MNFIKMLQSFKYAMNGLKIMLLHENNFKFHIASCILANLVAFALKFNETDWCIIIICCFTVMAVETINSAIEKTIDYISLEKHPAAGKIKDISAAAVFIVSMMAFIVGLVLVEKYLDII